jgi:hypothetical protein
LSAEEKKKLAADHLRELLEAKKKRATQTPAWKQISHHDHPAPRSGPSGSGGGADAPAATATPVRPRGDRGGG